MQQLGKEDYSSCKFITSHKTGFKPAPSGGNDLSWLSTLHNLFLSMHIYEQFQQKIAFSGLHTPFIHSRDKTIILKGEIFLKLPVEKWEEVQNCLLTSDLVNQNTRSNNASILGKELFQFFLGHCFWKSANIQICISDRSRTWSRIGNLRIKKVKNTRNQTL